MKIIVLNGSPKGKTSVTLQYIKFLQLKYTEHEFIIYNISQKLTKIEKREDYFNEIIDDVQSSDAIIWTFPVYIMLVPSNYKRFIELIFERKAEQAFKNKYTSAISTSKHFYDHTANNYVRAICDDLNMKYFDFYSADMYDLTEKDKRKNFSVFAELFFKAVQNKSTLSRTYNPLIPSSFNYSPGKSEKKNSTESKKILILSDGKDKESNLTKMVEKFRSTFTENIELINLYDVDMKGSCIGCIKCGYDNHCVYEGKDGFIEFFETKVKPAEIVVFAGEIRDRYFTSKWKQFFDRCFYNGHIPIYWGKQVAFIVSGPLGQIDILKEFICAYSEIQHANLVDIITDEHEDSGIINALLESLASRLIECSKENYKRPATQLGVGGAKIFRDIMYSELKFPSIADHKFYKRHGFYDYKKPDLLLRTLYHLSKFGRFRKYIDKNMKELMLTPFNKVFK